MPTSPNDHQHVHDHPHPHPHPHVDEHMQDHDHAHDAEHDHDQTHDHPHPHSHVHGHSHDAHEHTHGGGVWGWISTIFHLHGHSHQHVALAADTSFASSDDGIRTVWIALAALALTSVLQMVIVWLSGSVALLADTVHNIGDGLNSIPLLIAFYLARRAATRRYTYGYARAEDVAGILIVLSIAMSAAVIFYESINKLLHPAPLTNVGWIAVAAIIGFLGNETVALLQIRKGRQIGSAALVADGQHARTDGLTSLAVLLAAAGSWLGYPLVDPIIGLLIGVAILFITKDATLAIWYRLMDAIEPEYLVEAEAVVRQQAGVQTLRRLRMRWMGHRLHAEVYIAVDSHLSLSEGHGIAEEVRHALFHAIPYLAEVIVHVDPWAESLDPHHELTVHHEPVPAPIVD